MAKIERTRAVGAKTRKTSERASTRPSPTAAAPKEVAAAEGVHVKRKKGTRLPAEVSRAVGAALDKKAQDLVVLDLRHTPAFTDFFVLCSGLNQRQVKAIADAVGEALRGMNVRPAHTEGYDRAEWVLMDFFTFIVHVFTPQTRAFYGLERLWGDAERIEIPPEPSEAVKRH